MSPDLEGRRVHVVMGCRALAREPIMCQEQQASKRAGQGAREGNGGGKPLPGIYVLRLWLGCVATLLRIYTPRPQKGSADLIIAGLWESGV
jgi:hypothetical protein